MSQIKLQQMVTDYPCSIIIDEHAWYYPDLKHPTSSLLYIWDSSEQQRISLKFITYSNDTATVKENGVDGVVFDLRFPDMTWSISV